MGLLNKKRKVDEKISVKSEQEEALVEEQVLIPPKAPTKIVEEKPRYSVRTIATQTSEVIVDEETEQPIDNNTALVLILNELNELKKLLN